VQEFSPIQHRQRYSHPVLRSEARRELCEWEPYFQNLSEDNARTPKQRSDARLLVDFANWAIGEFDQASKIVQGLDFESIENEIAGLESWISEMNWRDQERLLESIDFAQLRIDDLSEQLSNSAEYVGFYDLITPDDSVDGVATDALVRLRSQYRDYLDKIGPDLRARYATAMDSLGVPSDAAIRYRLDMIGSAEFEPHEPELSAVLKVLLYTDEYTEDDFLKILRDLEQLRIAHAPIKESGLRLTDLPQTLTGEEMAPTNPDELRAPNPPNPKSPPEGPSGTNDDKAVDIPKPAMDFTTEEGRYKAVDDFIAYIFKTTGRQISKTSIWKRRTITRAGVSQKVGYKDPSGFKDWQRGEASKPATKRATEYFEAVLRQEIRIIF
jgi:hypothetical protein